MTLDQRFTKTPVLLRVELLQGEYIDAYLDYGRGVNNSIRDGHARRAASPRFSSCDYGLMKFYRR